MFIFCRSPVDSCDDFVLHAIGHLDDVEQLDDAPVRVGRAQPVELREHPQVLAHGQQPVARRLAARHHVDARAHELRLAVHVVALDARPAGRGREQRRENLDERRLAGAVRAEQAEQLASRHGQRDVAERDARLRLVLVVLPRLVDPPQPLRLNRQCPHNCLVPSVAGQKKRPSPLAQVMAF